MDLSKAYDCIPHDLIIVKLSAYGVDNFSLFFIWIIYLIGNKELKLMTLLVIMLAFLLVFPRFNLSDLCNFADDNSLCTSSKLLCHLISILKQDIVDILFWFKINQMVANPAKFQVMFMGTKEAVENFVIKDI